MWINSHLNMTTKGGFLHRRVLAFRYAWSGIMRFMRSEAHAKIHLLAAIMVVTAGFALDIAAWEWCAVILCIAGVFMGEAFNTAIERLADKVSKEHDELIGMAKDVAAGAVLLFVVGAVIVGLIVFVPKIINLI